MNGIDLADKPVLIEGGLGVDDRGQVAFVNDFQFKDVKRFYIVSNHQAGFVRAWHAHRHETKYVMAMQGTVIAAAVAIDNWEHPSEDAEVYRYVLSAAKPSVLYIPKGYANGFKSLTDHAVLIFFSTSSLEESRVDDVRFEAHYWDPWQIVER